MSWSPPQANPVRGSHPQLQWQADSDDTYVIRAADESPRGRRCVIIRSVYLSLGAG